MTDICLDSALQRERSFCRLTTVSNSDKNSLKISITLFQNISTLNLLSVQSENAVSSHKEGLVRTAQDVQSFLSSSCKKLTGHAGSLKLAGVCPQSEA